MRPRQFAAGAHPANPCATRMPRCADFLHKLHTRARGGVGKKTERGGECDCLLVRARAGFAGKLRKSDINGPLLSVSIPSNLQWSPCAPPRLAHARPIGRARWG